MPATIRIQTPSLRELHSDLESVELGLGQSVRDAMVESAEPVRLQTAANTPVGPGPQSPKDNLPHIGETIQVSPRVDGAAIVSRHPGAGVLEYGGTIAPKGTPIHIAPHEMARKAGDQKAGEVQRRVLAAIDRLLRRFGL